MKTFKFPAKVDFGQSHVYMLFLDGEINMTKSGNGLLGSRSLHCTSTAVIPYDLVSTLPKSITDLFTETHGSYKFVYLNDDDEASDYREWLQGELLTESVVEHMKDELLAVGWGIDKLLTKQDISRSHGSMIGFQHSIASSLKTARSDANYTGGSTRTKQYVDDMLAQEGFLLKIDWPHCEVARQMNWAWESFNCTNYQTRLYRDDKYESVYELLAKD